MIDNIRITNFKSILDIELPLSTLNIFVGDNKSGKTNILDAISLSTASSNFLLTDDLIKNCSIENYSPDILYPNFDNIDKDKILLNNTFVFGEDILLISLYYDPETQTWKNGWEKIEILKEKFKETKEKGPQNISEEEFKLATKQAQKIIKEFENKIKTFIENHKKLQFQFFNFSFDESKVDIPNNYNKLSPIGKNGEGLFNYLKDIQKQPLRKLLIKEIAGLITYLNCYENKKEIKDTLTKLYKKGNINEIVNFFEQQRDNKKFMATMFYMTILVSDEVPHFFAIENMEEIFTPNECKSIIKQLAEIAVEIKKQIIVTLKNINIIKDFDLDDKTYSLLSIYRNKDGVTNVKEILTQIDKNFKYDIWMKKFFE
ncbi:MAG: hypothetical protein MJ211_10985 [Bacteroidales bacterium]|nr:hypothetical protein [Bacteroidales bacterium]